MSSSYASADGPQQQMDEEGRLLQQMLDICRAFISKKTGQVESVMQLRVLLQSHPSLAPSLLFDVLVALQPEFDEERARKEERADDIRAFLTQIGNELLPSDVLALEMNALGADEPATKSRIVKSKTRIYYKQLKFNLLREESEGYAKLITELFHPSTPDADLILTVDSLIGQFNLDPNRVIDIILECFEHSPHKRELFVRLIRDFKVDKEDLRSILALKFVFCQRADYTPMSLYRLASLLAQEGMIDVLELFTLVNPTQKEIMDECKSLAELIRVRSLRAETISSSGAGLLATSNEAFPISSLLGANDAGGPEPSAAAPAVSFSAAIQCQTNEDRKLAGNRFDDSIIYKNQKLGLLCALLEHGCWDLAKPLLDRLPENYPFGMCRRIAMAVANVIHYKIEPFYRQKYPHYRDDVGIRMKESWERFTCKPELVKDWPMLFNDACQIAFQLGAYVGARHDVAIKLIRLLNIFYEDPDANELVDYDNLSNTIVDFCDCVLVPASTLLDSNFAYCDELWQIMCRHTYQMRYRIYHRWRTVHTERCWDLSLQRGKVLGMTRYIIKRLSKDTAKVMGRQLGKICHSYPTIPLDYLLSKVQDFQNFIGPVVESIRFLSSMEFDVLAYCLIENLAAPEKQDFKISDISYSPWLQSLASFAAAIFKRYALDFGGILQYIANQLKAAQTMDLIVLREIVTSISGVESSTDLTQDHLDALCGGDTLRGEASYLQMAKPNRRSINRLRDALLRDSLFEALSILIGQQKQFIVFRDYKNYPLKLTAQMLDQCQETFVQFFHFLRTNLKADQYAKRMPSALALLTEFHLPVEAAFCLTRPIYMNEIETVYNSAKQKRKEESAKEDEKGVVGSKVSKLDIAQKSELYREAFIEKVERLSDEVKAAFPDSFWNEMTLRLHTIFWLLSVNDLTVPVQAYERTIDKCKKELQEILPAGTFALAEITTRGGGQKRAAKDEERLTALEQKLEDEKRKQMDHNSRILNILSDEDVKKNMFAKSLQNRSIQMMRFLQSCVLPRVLCSEVDAVYCAEFVRTLHFTKTTDFQTIIFFDKIFNDITPIVAGLSERETVCFGRFCRLLLETILHWHSSRSVFQTECEGFPGCITKIRKKEMDEKATADAFNYEFYKTICYKWQIRLSKSFGLMLGQQNYVLIRNAITLMLKILPYFPVLTNLSVSIQKHVTSVRDKEKGNRYDLNLLASSYLVQLHKRNELWEKEKRETGKKRLYENHEFSDTKATKPTAGPRSSAAAPYSNGTTARKPLVTAPEKSSTAPSPTPTSGGTNKQGTTTDASPPKRSRPPIRSGTKN